MQVGIKARSLAQERSGRLVCRLLAASVSLIMIPLATVASVAGLLVFVPSTVTAEQSPGPQSQIEPAQLMALFHWAARLTDRTLPADLTLPVVTSISAEQISQRVCPDKPTRCRPIAAAYGIEQRDIIYRDTLDLSRLLGRSSLLHELVHFLQHQDLRSAINASCQQILLNERQAYRAQAAYLRHHGVYHPVGSELGLIRCPPDQLRLAGQSQVHDQLPEQTSQQ